MEIRLLDGNNGYEVLVNGAQVGKITWALEGDTMVMNGTYIEESLRGQDMGSKLLNVAAEYARDNQLKMKAECPFVVKMFDRTEAYDDIKA